MEGAICINEWLVQEGYLVLRDAGGARHAVPRADVDWSRTRPGARAATTAGCASTSRAVSREGIVAAGGVRALRDELIERLEALPRPGRARSARACTGPRTCGASAAASRPTSLVYFGDLAWRSNGSVGHGRYCTFENDTGPDDANHAQYGLLIAAGPGIPHAAP